MKKALLAFLLAMPCLSLFSQQDSLLKNFKFRIDHYRAVNLNIGSSGNISNMKLTANNITNNSAQGDVAGSYFALKSTDRILLTTTASLYSRYNGSSSKNSTQEHSSKSFTVNPNLSILNKWFTRNKFTELGLDISGSGYSNKNDYPIFQGGVSKDKNGQYSIAINTGIGTGRLENVTDMQNAIWLNEALTTAGQLSRPLTADELYELGRTVTQANNTRVLDTRRRTIFVLKTVDEYLQRKGLINKTDVAYFSNLNDILFFAFNNPRLSGTEKFIRLTPAIAGFGRSQYFESGPSKFKQTVTNASVQLSFGISKYVPQNLTRQNNYGASIITSVYTASSYDKYEYTGSPTFEQKGKPTFKRAGFNLFYEHAIYPNTRTAISINIQTQGGYQILNETSSSFGVVNIAASINYFISYRTRFTAGLGTLYQRNYYYPNPYFELAPENLQLYGNVGFAISL